jgi:AraC-like DNA-binding protein
MTTAGSFVIREQKSDSFFNARFGLFAKITNFACRQIWTSMNDYGEIGFGEYLDMIKPDYVCDGEVAIVEIDGSRGFVQPELYPVRLNLFSVMVMLRGSATIEMDYLPFTMNGSNFFRISQMHIFNGFTWSADFKGYYIVVPMDFMQQNLRLPPPPVKLLSYLRTHPVTPIDNSQLAIITSTVERLIAKMKRTDHIYQSALVRSEFESLCLEMMDVEAKNASHIHDITEPTYNESVVYEFVRLILENSKKEHSVLFYATELCMTRTQLSRILKAVTGKTAINWINNAQVIESKMLLRKKDLSVQRVAEMMNFSDQSAFGKFFKKHTGVSPVEYKNSVDPVQGSNTMPKAKG